MFLPRVPITAVMAPQPAFIDLFPGDRSSHPEMHHKIDAELRNCDSLWPRAPMRDLFPDSSGAAPNMRRVWLDAAVERIEWHCTHPHPDTEKWLLFLTCMSRMLLGDPTDLSEQTLLRTAVVATAVAERKAPVTPELMAALDSLVDQLVYIHDHSPRTFQVAFHMFRAGSPTIPWISARDFDSPEWSALLDLANHQWQSSGLNPKQSSRIAAAITKVGDDNLSAFVARTVTAIEACQPAPMSGAGMTMLRQMLLWAQAKPELAIDDALARLCSVRWQPLVAQVGLMKEWLGTLLQTLVLRSRDRAFACVERLANNPDTKDFREVVALYEQLMHEMLGDVSYPRTEGVDGFPLTTEMDRIVDAFLRASAPREFTYGDTAVHSTGSSSSERFHLALRQANAGHPALLRAMNARVHWLKQHEPPTGPRQHRENPWLSWCCDLGKLYGKILEQQPALDAADLAALCEVDALGWLGIAPTGPLFNACEAWISKHGFEPELTAAMQAWNKSVFGGGTAMALRKRISWLLWFDTAAPINEKACWSSLIRKDLRAMPAQVRGAWIALLGNVSFGIADQPTKKWLKPAAKLLQQVGIDEFQARVRAWFAPFQAGRELKLTVAGRDILNSLFWYSQLAQDPRVDEAVRWYATAKWKAKSDRDRTARLLPVWIHTLTERCPDLAIDTIHAYRATGQVTLMAKSVDLYEALCKRYGRTAEIAAPPPPPPIDREALMSKMMQKAMAGVLGDGAKLDGDTLVVSDPLGDRYEIGLRDGRIVRLSDGKTVRLEIDWSVPPFSPFKDMIDSGDLNNPFGRNYFRTMVCAQVLSGTLPVEVPIVEDES